MKTHPPSTHCSTRRRGLFALSGLLVLVVALVGFGVAAPVRAISPSQVGSENVLPAFVRGEIIRATYDGDTDDLLTAGLGQTGLQGAAPVAADPLNPTTAELRRLAIYTNYRAIVDVTPGSGYGTLYGPAVGPGATESGKIAGKEYLAYADDGTGAQNVTMMVQIPTTFDPQNACLVTAPSSGSRGVYGAIGGVGEWALKRGCAVAYTDKGTGMGYHDLTAGTVNLLTGERSTVADAGLNANFVATFDQDWATANPNRIAVKHAHSQQNPEADWGLHVLQSIEFAFHILNLPENYGTDDGGTNRRALVPDNTLVIASGVSNGGGASLRAAELDTQGWIDGVAVSEPNVNPTQRRDLRIEAGDELWALPNHSRGLLDYYTFLTIYAPCAVRDASLATAPFNIVTPALGDARCASLATRGLVNGATVEEQAADALTRIRAYGMVEEQLVLLPSHHAFTVFESIALLYTYSYGRFSVSDNICGFSYAAADPTFAPTAPDATLLANIFSTGNGIPPTSAIAIINDRSLGGPLVSRVSLGPGGETDQNLAGALCLRRLATGVDEAGEALTGDELAQSQQVRDGAAAVRANGNLQGKPTVIVHGRADSVIPVNYAGRAYFGLNQLVEGEASKLHYYEILNAQHFDAFNGFAGFNTRYIPIHHYALEALDLIYAHLTTGAALPPSQVIPAIPREPGEAAGTAVPITTANVPPALEDPLRTNRIIFLEQDKLVRIGATIRSVYLPLLAQ
ncbi:D-(-)-3-hydroxybutyrate oligomer hydrolase [Candidatus Chloroploca sp. M-50]|uniref:D-(-)-3-hydroxybutyrate oligomer hydrolase n=1 Tax=Candidatus Chloroploca mongolica TaxID=2528176 RepID=A0ABS4DC59_9CHLR|nr:3-hydroxybutyrate oligomer hydrolase family protein [Candidatus Chloroploca mongolica]MBP1467032.1 D-(-)-3-hydroxybutyrate oligomer hydrolase [Candidatus Chloroploca mongolica]